jgi:hypothetical protein
MKKLLLIFIALPMIGYGQQTVGLFSNQPSSYNGYTLFNSLGSTNTYLIDNCGNKVYEWNSNYSPAASVYLLENGNLLRTNRLANTTFAFGGSGGGIEILDPNSNVIWSYEVNSDSTLAHHDLEILPNGNILILAIEFISTQEANDYGSTINADRYSEMILEVNPTTDQIVWEWHAWDHLIQDTDPNLLNYGTISDYPGRININYAFDGTDPDWLHANSIDYNADLDQIIINSPTFNEFWIIDHSTTTAEAADSIGGFSGNGGDILYRWGNPQAYNRGDTLDQVFDFQHDAHWIPSGLPDQGKIMIFNNGDQRLYSSIDIIEPPLDTNNSNNYILTNNLTPYGPLNLYWSYSDSINFYSRRISGAQQLENGNILICSGIQARLFEIEYQTDSVVWDYIIPVVPSGPITQGAQAFGNNLFRAHRFSPSYSGFDSLQLTPTTVIELNPLPSTCQIFINGCTDSLACNYDSLVTLDDGSCAYSSTSTTTITACDSYVWPTNGLTYTTSVNDTVIGVNAAGCAETNILDLTINNSTTSTDTQVACNSYVWPTNGLTYTTSVNDTVIGVNAAGCAETNILVLTISGNPFATISQNGIDLEVTMSDTYSWNTGEITQTITPIANGWYWCIVTDVNGCIGDTAYFEVINIVSAINEKTNTAKKLLRITNMLGQETPFRKNTPLFYNYDDGTVEKRIVIE